MKTVKVPTFRWKWAIVFLALLSILALAGAEAEQSGIWGQLVWTLSDSGELVIAGSGEMNHLDDVSEEAVSEAVAGAEDEAEAVAGAEDASGAAAGAEDEAEAVAGAEDASGAAAGAEDKAGAAADAMTAAGAAAGAEAGGRAWLTFKDDIRTVIIQSGITSIGNAAFRDCVNLTGITLPDTITAIGDDAFAGCSGLKAITLPDTVIDIAPAAFAKCDARLIIPEGSPLGEQLSRLGYTFRHPGMRYDIRYLYDGETRTGIQLCRVDENLSRFDLPEDITSISSKAFAACTKITRVRLTEGVRSIGSHAFAANVVLAVPEDSYAAKWAARNDCQVEIWQPKRSVAVTTDGNGTASANKSSGVKGTVVTLRAKPNPGYRLKKWQVVSGGVRVADNQLTIDKANVEVMAVFELEKYTVSVTADKNGTVSARPASGTMGTAVTLKVTPKAGYRLKSLQVLSGGVSIKNDQFIIGTKDVKLRAVFEPIVAGNAKLTLHAKTQTATVTGPKNKSITVLEIPSTYKLDGVTYSVTEIGDGAFRSCSKLKKVTIGSRVRTIGENAFMSCAALTTVTIGSSVTTIPENAFRSCKKLTTVTIGANVTVIGKNAFNGCAALKTVKGGKAVTIIGEGAFANCKKLPSFTIQSKVKTIGKSAFAGCTALTKVTGGDSVTAIGDMAFNGDKALTGFPVLSKLLTVGASAFQKCVKLKDITLPATVKSIGGKAFFGCSALKSITVKTTKLTASNVKASAFKNISKAAVFEVPRAKGEAYRRLLISRGAPKTCTFRAGKYIFNGEEIDTTLEEIVPEEEEDEGKDTDELLPIGSFEDIMTLFTTLIGK